MHKKSAEMPKYHLEIDDMEWDSRQLEFFFLEEGEILELSLFRGIMTAWGNDKECFQNNTKEVFTSGSPNVMVQKWLCKGKKYVPLRANFTTYIQISPTSETGEDI